MSTTIFDRLGTDWTNFDGRKVRLQSLFFIHFVAFSGVVVFRNVYLGEMGMSESAMGQIGFLMTVVGIIAQPMWGMVTDYFHAERAVLIGGAGISAVGLLAYPFADGFAEPFLFVVVGTVIFSIFHAPIVPIANGLVLFAGYEYGKIRAFGSAAFGIGSLGFGFFVATLGVSSIVYVYVFGMILLAIVVGTFANPRAEPDQNEDELPLSEAIRTLVGNVDLLAVLLVAFILGMSVSGGSAFFSVYMRAIDAEMTLGAWTLSADALTGLSWAVKTAFETIAFVYALRFAESYNRTLIVGGVAVTVPFAVYGLTVQPWAIISVQVIAGLGYGLYNLALVNLVYIVASNRVVSTAQTVLTGVGLGLGGAIGQIVAGNLADLLGLRGMYPYLAVIGLVGAGAAVFVRRRVT